MYPTTHQSETHPRRLAIAAAVIAPLVFAACSSSSSPKSSAKPATTTAEKNAVQIKLIAYRPATMAVAAGTTVTWNQMDPGFHTVTSGTVTPGGGNVTEHPDGMFASGEIATGKKYSHTFAKSGTYKYFCEIHPATMTGEITVK